MSSLPAIKLIRTDTTLDLSQKAEKGSNSISADAYLLIVENTNCNALAFAVGTIHGNYIGKPKIYHDRLKEIAKVISVSLVLHGGSGNTEEDLVLAIDGVISKININTAI